MIISKKLFGCVIGAIVSGSIGGAAAAAVQLFGFTLLVVIPPILALAGLFSLVAYKVVHRQFYREMRTSNRNQFATLISACAIADSLVAILYAVVPELWWLWTILMMIAAAVEYAAFRAHDWVLATQPTAEQFKAEKRERAERQEQAATSKSVPPEVKKLRRALRKSKLDWLEYQSYVYVNDTDPQYTVSVPSNLRQEEITADGGKRTLHQIGPQTAEQLAIAFSEVLQEAERAVAASEGRPAQKMRLKTSWVTVQKGEWAGEYTITVNTSDVMAKLLPYLEDIEHVQPVSITEPCHIGNGVDGAPIWLYLAQHGNAIGQTQSGKSSFINVLIAYLTRCHDALLWVGGTHKLAESISPWLENYRGTGLKSPIDRIAYGGQDVINMLVDLLLLSDFRQNTPIRQRPARWKAIVCLIDETHAVADVTEWALYLGKKITPEKAFSLIIKMTASAGIYLVLANQRGTLENYGDKGGDVIANMGYTAAFRSRDFAELGRQMGNDHYKLPVPPNQGEGWLNPGLVVGENGEPEPSDGLPLHFKTLYVQQEMKRSRALHDGPTESDIGWSRRHLVHELDEREANYLGANYLDRARTADEQLAYLEAMFATIYDNEQEEGETAAASDGREDILAWMTRAWGEAPTEPPAASRPATPTPATDEPMTVRDRILSIITDEPAKPSEIARILTEDGYRTSTGKPISAQQVHNNLKNLADDGEAHNTGGGVWAAASTHEGATV